MDKQPEFFKCNDCSKIYKSKHSLHIHFNNVHGNADSRRHYKCEVCGKQYEIKGSYEKHVRAHQHPEQCPHCEFTALSTRALSGHIAGHRDNNQFCVVCEKFFPKDFYATHYDMCKPAVRQRPQGAPRRSRASLGTGQGDVVPPRPVPIQSVALSEGEYRPVEYQPFPSTAPPVQQRVHTENVQGPGVDVEIPIELLTACQALTTAEHMELTGVTAKHEGAEHPIKVAVIKKDDVVHLSLEASLLGPAFQRAISGRWHCSFDAAYIMTAPEGEAQGVAMETMGIDLIHDMQDAHTTPVTKVLETGLTEVLSADQNKGLSEVPIADQNIGLSEVPTADQDKSEAAIPELPSCVEERAQAYLGTAVGMKTETEERVQSDGNSLDQGTDMQKQTDQLPEESEPLKSQVSTPVDSDDGGDVGDIDLGETEQVIEDLLKSSDEEMGKTVPPKMQTRSRSQKRFSVSLQEKTKSTKKSKLLSAKPNQKTNKNNPSSAKRILTKTPISVGKAPEKSLAKKSEKGGTKKSEKCIAKGSEKRVAEEPDKSVAKKLEKSSAKEPETSVPKEPESSISKTPARRGRKPKALRMTLKKTSASEEPKEQDPNDSDTSRKETPSRKGQSKAPDEGEEGDWTPAKTTPKRPRGRPSGSFSAKKRKIKTENANDEGDGANRSELVQRIYELSNAALYTDPSKTGTPSQADDLYCLICNRTFAAERRRYIPAHLTDIHKVSLEEYLKILEMTDLEERSKVVEGKKQELAEEQRTYKAKKYNKDEKDLMKCPACVTVVAGIPALRTHVISAHSSEPNYQELAEQVEEYCRQKLPLSTEVLIPCPFCRKEKNGLQGLKTHMRLVHSGEPDLPRAIKEQQSQHRALYNQFRRNQYRKLVTTNKPSFQCKFCPDIFAFRSSRARHVKFTCMNNPNRLKTFVCANCNQRFPTKEEMEEHRAVHKLENFKWVCDVCGLMRSTRAGMYEHKRHHHNTKPPQHQCPFCDKAFYNKERCERHQTSHTNLRKYQCEICGNHYKTKAAVGKHQKAVHFNRYKYYCKDCGHGVQKLQYLETHVCGRVRRSQDPDAIMSRMPNPEAIKSETSYTPEETIVEDQVAANYLIDLNPQGTISISIPVEATTHEGTQYLRPQMTNLLHAAQEQFGSKLALDSKPGTRSLKYETDGQIVEETVIAHGAPLVSSVPLSVARMDGIQSNVIQIQSSGGHTLNQIQTPGGHTLEEIQNSGGHTLNQIQAPEGQTIEQIQTSEGHTIDQIQSYSYQNTYGGIPTVLDYSQGSPQVVVQYSDQSQP